MTVNANHHDRLCVYSELLAGGGIVSFIYKGRQRYIGRTYITRKDRSL